MNRVLRNTLCRLLIALMAWTPFQMANAAMLGTDTVVAPATAQAERGRVLGMIERGEVASQLQAFGLDPAQAKERVNAMTDAEVGALANKIDSLPAGGIDGGGLLLLIVIAAVIWWAVSANRR
jgi:hypothetical protein